MWSYTQKEKFLVIVVKEFSVIMNTNRSIGDKSGKKKILEIIQSTINPSTLQLATKIFMVTSSSTKTIIIAELSTRHGHSRKFNNDHAIIDIEAINLSKSRNWPPKGRFSHIHQSLFNYGTVGVRRLNLFHVLNFQNCPRKKWLVFNTVKNVSIIYGINLNLEDYGVPKAPNKS